MKPTLLVLAAGMGSRYGGLKQMDEIGPSGESIIDYSVYDAIRAGFGKVVFVIRHSFAEQFIARFEPRLKGRIDVEFVYQELDYLPDGFTVPDGREKPWGTGHAILMAKDAIRTPFAIVNADDFYGQEAYQQVADFLNQSTASNQYAMVGYALRNTLSEHGTVSRGVCQTDALGNLESLVERTKIGLEGSQIYYYDESGKTPLTGQEPVSMNFWAFKPLFFEQLASEFVAFLQARGGELKSEFYFNAVVDKLIKTGVVTTRVINTPAKWFGVTYQEDKPMVKQSLTDLIARGDYPQNLWQ
ncbi:MobA-like NTP transferase protein [Breznakibacter xylanolyticus]|uniref:MobA-like NTP transferase protein n=1 Tax=Breznakibacter xylanolyticus TaxID=990 RepID=A0A2W7MPI5_9BACT|nr:sugar phosphate nucleotidyltransferase [Breznakibacter xylanolyticus]MBN2744018.1 NTP transferase domain-containing protein [Marinilabiliaceae bacterium]PZX10105.1 MobA-like NTP transferase protein [Breznakibacter xylanolyticus]